MVLDPIPQSLPVHFFGSRPQPPTSRGSSRLHDSYCAMSDHDSYMCHDSYTLAMTNLTHIAAVLQRGSSQKCRGTSQCYKRRYVGDIIRANVWYDLFLCVTWLIYIWAQRSAEARRSVTNAGTCYCIWSVISSFSIFDWWSSSLGLFYHVPLKRDQGNWDWREKCRGTSHCCKRRYGVATISRLLKIIGLFCRISSLS